MNKLLLIKHSLPNIDPDLPAAQWNLSGYGRQRCIDLARKIASDVPGVVVSSREPKASQTGELLAGQLNIPWHVVADLHEHERPQTGFLSRQELSLRSKPFLPGQTNYALEPKQPRAPCSVFYMRLKLS